MTEREKKLTPESCRNYNMRFRPQTAEEVVAIQQKLFDFGFSWPSNTPMASAPQYIDECLKYNMILKDNTIYYDNGGTHNHYPLHTLAQFDENYRTPMERMADMFNEISARQDAIEAKLDRLLKLMDPPPATKLPLPKK